MTNMLIANHFRAVFFGGNWTSVHLQSVLADVSVNEAQWKKEGFNSIATLSFHIGYYVEKVLPVLKGGALIASDKESFLVPYFEEEAVWEQFKNHLFDQANQFAVAIESLTEEQINGDFIDGKYGSMQRNLWGIIEHTHYHMGQIVMLKKLARI